MISFDTNNQEQQKAFDLVANTNTCLFITGKAGTGKTTFVKRIQENIDKNFLVLAPTGIAAITVGGQTMHSFFGFPMEVLGPHTQIEMPYDHQQLLEKIDTIIVDEASMVRSDMVDGMDRCLRMVFHTHMPFGGKQVIFVGDLFQLPPVVVKGSVDDEMLSDLYGKGTPFFYKANVLKRMNLPKIEFRKVYRQNDATFINILNKMRNGTIQTEDLELLNKHVRNTNDCSDFSVILTGYNGTAAKINDKKLNNIIAEEFCYTGETKGTFRRFDYPAPESLKLKIGAQVIFCRNDYLHGCVNGTIAKVVYLDNEHIRVALENGNEFEVNKVTWENKEKVYNRETHQIESDVIGTYTQYPLKLAWAITIHKSQGMTFDRMHFDLTRGVFAPGQTYVAISRMRTLEGLTLSNPIMPHHVMQDPEIRAFANSYNDIKLIDDELEIGKLIYQHLTKKDYDAAVKVCLQLVQLKAMRHEWRNAALLAKKMFDIMLDDQILLGRSKDVAPLKECSMTCNFLNAVFCLYGNRYEESIGYADMVLSRKVCLEAMFIKGRALYELGRYEEAYDICYKLLTESKKSEDKKITDMKQYLFEAKINERIGNSNTEICKKLIAICPENVLPYILLRRDLFKSHKIIETTGDSKSELIDVFNNMSISEKDFIKMFEETDKKSKLFFSFKRMLKRV